LLRGAGYEVHIEVPDPPDDWIARVLNGTYIPDPPIQYLLGLVQPGTTLLDVGAHLGTLTLPAAALGAQVTAVEAATTNLALLRRSIERNGLADHITVLPVAAWDHPTTISFAENGPWGSAFAPDRPVTVEARPLDEFVERAEYVKIDVEGAESEALSGMRRLLDQPRPPHVVLEVNRFVLAGRSEPLNLTRTMLADAGYSLHLIGPGWLLPADPDDWQPETVADYVASRGEPRLPAGWALRSPRLLDECAVIMAAEARHSNAAIEHHVAEIMEQAPEELRGHPLLRDLAEPAAPPLQPQVRARSRRLWKKANAS